MGFQVAFGNPDVLDRAKLIEDTLFGHATIDVDERIVKMTSDLVKNLDNTSDAVVDAGMFILIKRTNKSGNSQILGKRLTVSERRILNNNPSLIQEPQKLLSRLEDLKQVPSERISELKKY